jgi:hypothetical protein
MRESFPCCAPGFAALNPGYGLYLRCAHLNGGGDNDGY